MHQSLRNYKTLISGQDIHPGRVNCETPKLEENSVDRLHTTPEYSNHLYGSTPESGVYFSHPFERRIHSKLPGATFNVLRADARSVNQLESHGFNYDPGRGHVEDDYVGPAMELVNNYKLLNPFNVLQLCRSFRGTELFL